MKFLLRHKYLITIVALLVIGFFWYGSSDDPSALLSTQSAEQGSPAEKDLVSTLLALRAISLSGTIFSDPAFRKLKDFSTQIVPEPVGRKDPFAPLSRGAASGAGADAQQLFPAVRP